MGVRREKKIIKRNRVSREINTKRVSRGIYENKVRRVLNIHDMSTHEVDSG